MVRRWREVRFCFAAVLLAAGAAKGVQLMTVPSLDVGILSSKWVRLGLVELEFLLATLLLSGMASRFAWSCLSVLFWCFAFVTGWEVLHGHTYCGCFGLLPAKSSWMLLLDCAGLVVLWVSRPERGVSSHTIQVPKLYRLSLFSAVAVLGLTVAIRVANFAPAILDGSGLIRGDASLVVLEPKSWLGKPFPLLKHVLVDADLSRGRWLLLLVHMDCPRCREVMEIFAKRANGGYSLVIIEIPPFSGDRSSFAEGSSFVFGRLEDKNWFAATPAIMKLVDGKVTDVELPL